MKTKNGVRLGISLPQSFPDERIDHTYLRNYVQAAEAAGFEDAWLTEGILTPNYHLEPVSYLSWLAAITERIRLGVEVLGRIREAGAQHILINPCYEHRKQMELLLAQVLPQL